MAALLLGACGGSSPRPAASYGAAPPPEPALEPAVAAQRWYRATTTCAQGPWELELAPSGARWGEEIELRLSTPRRIGLHAELIVDDDPPLAVDRVLDARGGVGGAPENARCVADARERLALARGGGGAGGGTPGTPAVPGRLVGPPPARATTTARLELDEGAVTSSIDVVRISLRDRPVPAKRIRIRFWSAEPNDLEGVLFGIAHIEWRPNVPEGEYLAFLELRERRLREQLERERLERERLEAERRARVTVVVPAPVVTVKVDPETERRRREAEERRRLEAERRLEKLRREAEEERRRRAVEDEERARRRAIEVALEIERRARREQFCATHHDDRGCWGPGGYAMHAAFENHRKERTTYCAAHAEDARCWSAEERARRRKVWQARIDDALAPPPPPDGPPPDPLAEEVPPKLSANAEWRPGYWQWTAGTWVWLAGMWRVPDEDIASEQTTTAPAAPPPPQPETPPPPPVAVAQVVWVPGFWQWSGSTWVWIGGSYQLRPDPRTRWRAAEWQPRGSVHVLIPGGWVRLGGAR